LEGFFYKQPEGRAKKNKDLGGNITPSCQLHGSDKKKTEHLIPSSFTINMKKCNDYL